MMRVFVCEASKKVSNDREDGAIKNAMLRVWVRSVVLGPW
jgi:hypothetical protein